MIVRKELLRNRVLGEDAPDEGPRLKASALVISVDYGRAGDTASGLHSARPGGSWPAPSTRFARDQRGGSKAVIAAVRSSKRSISTRVSCPVQPWAS